MKALVYGVLIFAAGGIALVGTPLIFWAMLGSVGLEAFGFGALGVLYLALGLFILYATGKDRLAAIEQWRNKP